MKKHNAENERIKRIPRSSTNQNVDDIARAVVKAMADQNSQIGI